MRWSWMSGLGRAVVVAAALALVLCDLSSRPGLTPAEAGFFSKAKSSAKDSEKDKDKDKDKGSSSSTSSKSSKTSGGGVFSKTKDKPGSSSGSSGGSAKKPDNDGTKKTSGGFFGGTKGKPTTTSKSKPTSSGKSVGTKTSSGGIFGGAKGTPGASTSTRSGGTVSGPTVGRSGGGYFEKATRPSEPVWQPRRSPSGGFFKATRGASSQTRNAQGYFSHVNRLKSSSRVRYDRPYPRTVDWWYWWYPYDLRYYHWHFGYYDPFATDYAFIFVYVGGHHPSRYYPYYIYHPVPRPGVIVITRWSDRDEASYYDRSRLEGELGDAVRDIEYGWRYEDAGRLMRHVDARGDIRVYYGDTYSHNMTAGEFEELTADAFETTRTGSMRLDRVIRLSDGWAKATGRHVFYDPNGDRREVFVYYLLEEVRDGWHREWVIREIGQGPEPY